MTSPLDPRSELLALCDRLFDGDFTIEDRNRLEALVLENPDLRKLYVEIIHQHAALRQNASRVGSASLSEVLEALPEVSEPAPQIVRFRFASWPLKIAAALALFAGTWWVAHSATKPSLATLVETKSARWESSSLPTEPGSKLGRGRLRLAEGVAKVIFQSGAEVSLEGPAELELIDRNSCFLHSGALVAHVPKPARGFVVATAEAHLIDHGTDFGISTDPAGRAQVQVLQGDVELRHDRSGQTLRLATRDSASVTPERLIAGAKGEGEPDRNAFDRPEAAAQRPVVTITTGTGSGDAAYVVSPGSPLHESDTLLLLKNAPEKRYLRKAYLRFDLSGVHSKVADARLTLNFEATGFGYASLNGDSVFAVYGLTDPDQENWTGAGLTWETAPAFSPDGGTVNTTQAFKLGTFTLPAGVVSGTPSLSSQALADFLTAHQGRSATLIIVRETSERRLNAAVHGFAGNRHPTLAPPTLRLTLAEK